MSHNGKCALARGDLRFPFGAAITEGKKIFLPVERWVGWVGRHGGSFSENSQPKLRLKLGSGLGIAEDRGPQDTQPTPVKTGCLGGGWRLFFKQT